MNRLEKTCLTMAALAMAAMLATSGAPQWFLSMFGPAGYFAVAFGIDFAHSFYTGKKSLLMWPLRLAVAGLRAWQNRPQPMARRDPAFQRVTSKVVR